MASSKGSRESLYPDVLESNPETHSPFLSSNPATSRPSLYPSLHDPAPATTTSSSLSMYPSLDMTDLVENLFPDADEGKNCGSASPENPHLLQPPVEEALIRVPGAVLHLIDRHRSVELGCGDFSLVRLRQGDNVVAVLARVGDAVQWPLAKDEAAVRLGDAHYFFSLHVPEGSCDPGDDEDSRGGGDGSENILNYGLTFAAKGQEGLLKELDGFLDHHTSFSVHKVEPRAKVVEVLDESVAKETTPAEVTMAGPKREIMEEQSAAYWTTLAPNVEDYSGGVAKAIAVGSGQLIRGIVWCGDVAVDRLKWGNDMLKSRMAANSKPTEVSKQAMRRMKRVKRVTKMSQKVAGGVLSGVVKVSGFFTSSVVNSKAGKKFFGLLPGEIVLASLDGFGKICDAVEVIGKNVMSTSATVTTGLVSHRYGEQAADLTNQGLDAAGHAVGTAWAVFKIRKAFNPKNAIKPTTLVKSAAKATSAESKSKHAKS
uniref:Spartin n=1 Tax=Anthurium amnicola TaxID=1678845 RepID=A0A1D1Z6L2_9ARAE